MTDRPVSEQPSFNPNDTTLLVHARPMRVGNSTGGLDEVVMYESQHWNEKQLYKLKKTLTKARQKGQAAAVLLTSDAGQPPMHDAANDRIRTHDWRIFSPPPIDKAAAQRYAHLLDEAGSNKGAPFVAVFNGCVHSAAMNWFRAATARVCTEHVIISPARIASTDETLVYSPVFGLYTLTHLHGPVGIEFYLQFNPSVRLRAPDCLLLGLVDRFVPEKYLGDWLRRLRAAFPLGSKVGAATAQQLQEAVLTGDKHWPGCGVIDCWKAEIEHCFGETTSLEQMLDRVGQLSKPWALATIDYVRSLPPLLAKIMYEAIQQGKLLNWHECNQLESVIAANWSQSTDAHRLSAFQTTRIQPTWNHLQTI
ncbi:hypothetical protein BDF19DRAFT_142160 [Syncephalis fuscata]|nr:hypothetical protein BDF19DRAFT_142160 [Syncephalis fuscata]